MRLARTIWDETKAQQISTWLKARGVTMEVQPYPADQPSSWRIWVVDEEQLEPVRSWIDEIESGKIQLTEAMKSLPEAIALEIEPQPQVGSPFKLVQNAKPEAWLTQCLVILLVVIHVALHVLTSNSVADEWHKKLLIDDPMRYGSYQASHQTTSVTWPGLYAMSLVKFREISPPASATPAPHSTVAAIKPVESGYPTQTANPSIFLECIRHGEIWRLITPVLMHGDWLHLLFNVMWLSIMGVAIEPRLGSGRFALLMLSAGIISNLAQYLMSGYQFLGFSGIVMALVAFSYVRLRRFPWEDYPIPTSTFTFVGFYLILTLFLQLLSFILEGLGWSSIHLGIANASHLGGLAVGWLFGSMRTMSTRQ